MASNVGRQLYKIYVGNIPWTVATSDLKKHFTQFGNLQSAFVVFDKNTGFSKNYGFVVFNSKEGFDKSRSSVHELEGNKLKIDSTHA